MRCLPLRSLAVSLLLIQTIAPQAVAVPYGEIRWGSCTGASYRYDPSSTSETAAVTVSGITGKIREIAFTIRIWAGGSQVSDAWRYDENGCEAGLLRFTQPRLGPCPVMTGANRVEASQVEYIAFDGDWTKGTEFIRYQALFDPMTATSSTTYTLALVQFDHPDAALGATQGASQCGCLERPLCISLWDVRYKDDSYVEHTVLTLSGIHWNDPANTLACPIGPDLCTGPCPWEGDTLCVASTPAMHRSWGNLKAGYR